jgi:hypothetical protein
VAKTIHKKPSIQNEKGFFDAQKAGVALAALPASSRAAYAWLEAPAFASDPVPGGYFAVGTDYVKVRRGLGEGLSRCRATGSGGIFCETKTPPLLSHC